MSRLPDPPCVWGHRFPATHVVTGAIASAPQALVRAYSSLRASQSTKKIKILYRQNPDGTKSFFFLMLSGGTKRQRGMEVIKGFFLGETKRTQGMEVETFSGKNV